MNRKQFMDELKGRLHYLPFDEVRQAVDYYEQYFDEAGEQNEQAVLAELGSPAQVASQIIGEFAMKGAAAAPAGAPPKKRGLSAVWIVILGIFAAPIALPLAIAAVAVAFSLIVAIFAVVVSIAAAGAGLLAAGIVCVFVSIPAVSYGAATFVFFLGVGLVSLGTGAAIMIGGVRLAILSVRGLSGALGKFLLRRGTK